MLTKRTDFYLNKNQQKLYYRISDEMGGRVELRNAHERRWASELEDKNLVVVECLGNNQTHAYVPIYNFLVKKWDGTFGRNMEKNYTTEIIKAPDLITAIGNYKSDILGVEFSDISSPE